MENFDFFAKEWPVITQAPHIALAGLFAVLVAAWSVTKWHYTSQLASLRERVELLKEKVIDAQARVEELTGQIESNEQQAVLLKSSSFTVTAFDNLVSAANQLAVTLSSTRRSTKQSSTNLLIPLNWRHEPPDTWKASSSWPDVGFRIERESNDCFALLGAKTCLGKFASLEDATRGAEEYRYRKMTEEGVPASHS
jgi:hypothetical protein